MTDFSLEDFEFIKFLANSDFAILEKGMNEATKDRLISQIGPILRAYYYEKTSGNATEWIEIFKKHGISEDDGKAAVACARRLGIAIF